MSNVSGYAETEWGIASRDRSICEHPLAWKRSVETPGSSGCLQCVFCDVSIGDALEERLNRKVFDRFADCVLYVARRPHIWRAMKDLYGYTRGGRRERNGRAAARKREE